MHCARRTALLGILSIAVGAPFATAQEARDLDSQTVTVVPGPLTGDAKVEDEYWTRNRQIDKLLTASRVAEAIELIDANWKIVTSHEFLKDQRPWVMQDRGRALMRLGKIEEASKAFQARIDFELEQRDCANLDDDSLDATNCGEAFFQLATAQLMLQRNPEATTSSLRSAEFYSGCLQQSYSATESARFSCRLRIGQATVMAGMAQVRAGISAEGRHLLTVGISELEIVAESSDASSQAKTEATRMIEIARETMSGLR